VWWCFEQKRAAETSGSVVASCGSMRNWERICYEEEGLYNTDITGGVHRGTKGRNTARYHSVHNCT
jgi:hypothetical protein